MEEREEELSKAGFEISAVEIFVIHETKWIFSEDVFHP